MPIYKRSLNNLIPPLVHYIYLGGNDSLVDETYKRYIRSCIDLNPRYRFILWTETSTNVLLNTTKIASRIKDLMNPQLRKLESRTDVLRFLLMKLFGGIYLDMDTICYKPFDLFINHNSTCMIGHEPPLQTLIIHGKNFSALGGFLACYSEHPFFDQLLNNIDLKKGFDDIMVSAGPFFLTENYKQYTKNNNNSDPIDLADYRRVLPGVDKIAIGVLCKNVTAEFIIKACNDVKNYTDWLDKEGERNSFVCHDWIHVFHYKFKPDGGFDALKEFSLMKQWPF